MANTAQPGTGTGVEATLTRTFSAQIPPATTTPDPAPTTGQLWPR